MKIQAINSEISSQGKHSYTRFMSDESEAFQPLCLSTAFVYNENQLDFMPQPFF